VGAGCGDGVRGQDEACDDGNRLAGDGCSADCLEEAGFSCAIFGTGCTPIAICGDARVAASEQCDDGNLSAGDGCSARCLVELGKKCEGQPSLCSDTVCGDSLQEGSESCDDGNTQLWDGCSVRCTVEPSCVGVSCVSLCGDGFVGGGELCDDGNRLAGDGCSSTCVVEQGFTCVVEDACEELAGRCVLRVPSVIRDFADTHPDFANNTCTVRAPGAVATRLDPNGRPLLEAAGAAQACLSTAANFNGWFTANPRNTTLTSELVLFDDGNGGYINRFRADGAQFAFAAGQTFFDGTPLYFPADGVSGATAQVQAASIPVQYGPASVVPENTLFPGSPGHNFYFTTELEQWFQYQAQTRVRLTIGADDDVWVFLNGQLALDLGGVHEPMTGSLNIDAGAGLVTVTLPDGQSQSTPTGNWGLVPGNLYTLGVFHAERQAPLSSLLLGLTGVEQRASRCSPVCGDGVLSAGEECDDGLNEGGYGECSVGCVMGPYCGDGIQQPEFGETCDVGPGGDAGCRGCVVVAP
jgi:fibro-slime domain-containing protein